MYQKMCDNIETKVGEKLATATEAFVKDLQVTEDAFNTTTKNFREFINLTVEESKQTLTEVQQAQTKFGATLSHMGTVFNEATTSLHNNQAFIVKKLDKQNLSHAVSQFSLEARFTRLERLITDSLKPKDDDKKGEKVVEVNDDDDDNDDNNNDHPSQDKKDSYDKEDDQADENKPKDVEPVKKPPTTHTQLK